MRPGRPPLPPRITIRHRNGIQIIRVQAGPEGKSVLTILDVLRELGFEGVLEVGGNVLASDGTVHAGDDVRFSAQLQQPQAQVRNFMSGSALVLSAHYYVPWPDLRELDQHLRSGRWLLLTAPWQCGKSSLLKALAAELERDGYLVLITTLTDRMIAAGNNTRKPEVDAADDFFELLKSEIATASRGRLRVTDRGDGVSSMFQQGGRQIIWFVDEAQLLREMYHSTGLATRTLLHELRECKQYCRPCGSYWLCSFSLCGLPMLADLIGDMRDQRRSGYPHSSPLPPSPLSMDVSRGDWNLSAQQIYQMLREYAHDRDLRFSVDEIGQAVMDDESDQHEQALMSIATDIFSRTWGHKGMVGCCCKTVERMEVTSWDGWLKLVRSGTVAMYTFTSRCYNFIRNVELYSQELKEVLVECVKSGDGSAEVDKQDTVLEALDDGVLVESRRTGPNICVRFSSGLLLEALLKNCLVAPMAAMPPPTDSLLVAFEAAFTLMDPSCFLRPEVLDSLGQPSEYVMQSQLLLALKFVIGHGVYVYTGCSRYKVLVEVTERDESGQRRPRMDIFLENGSQAQGIEVQTGGTAASIEEQIKRSEYYRALHGCQMHYVCFWVGEEESAGTKEVIMAQASNFPAVTCWYVCFSRSSRLWSIARVESQAIDQETGEKQRLWHAVEKAAAAQFPQILLETAEPPRRW